jgi:hypothetical protein
VIVLLRLVGVMNAAVWLGAAFFFIVGAPVVFSPVLKQPQNLGVVWPGIIAQMLVERLFVLEYICSIIALVHAFAEWLYLGKPLHRLTMSILVALFVIAFGGGLFVAPRLKLWHEVKYGYGRGTTSTQVQRVQAGKNFAALHGIYQTLNVIALCGLAVYMWRVSSSPAGPRFTPANKFRG